jgi:hypothetical protein
VIFLINNYECISVIHITGLYLCIIGEKEALCPTIYYLPESTPIPIEKKTTTRMCPIESYIADTTATRIVWKNFI